MERLKIGLVEDDKTILHRYRSYLENIEEVVCVTAVSSAENFLSHLDDLTELDAVLLDIDLPGISGIKAIPKIKKRLQKVNIIMLTSFCDDETIFKALRAGASGYLLKNFTQNELRRQLLSLNKEGMPLSPEVAKKIITYFNPPSSFFSIKKSKGSLTQKEKMTLHYLIKGLSYNGIGEQMEISLNSVRHHIKNIYKKLQVNSRAKLIDKYKN